ncbi:WD repeat-containing [Hirsutella rhossiliensis]|uniref:WD repeat-containing n=1 Tax=Hirsutella rhossiliensis TaxID=111463 RepID=A0A9P8MTI1_9HYPO|nr:WD repeat-containing [Hirsutella rhossiliensis]KAH0959936.1 WD repeat-containing [Hirsutella rhossiliensis]
MSAPGLDSAPGSAVQYAYMFEKNKGPTKQLDALLRAIARHTILELGDKTDSYLTPTKLAAFYQAVGGDYDTLFVDTPYASLSLIWQATGCQHTLQPTHDDFAPPIIPALTMRGFSRWESLEILLGPEEHVPFMQYAVKNWDLRHPETGEAFPPDLPACMFPTEADIDVDRWHKSCAANATGSHQQPEPSRPGRSPHRDDAAKERIRRRRRPRTLRRFMPPAAPLPPSATQNVSTLSHSHDSDIRSDETKKRNEPSPLGSLRDKLSEAVSSMLPNRLTSDRPMTRSSFDRVRGQDTSEPLHATERKEANSVPVSADSGTSSNIKSLTSISNSTLSPSSSIREVLAHENVDVLATFLEQRFTQIARGDYAWMAELRDVGYTHAEIAQLLYERTHDSPWIYFEPKDIPSAEVMPGHHLDGCAHRISGTLPGRDRVSWPPPRSDQDRELIRIIEELCGLGGVCPSSRDAASWNRTTEFQEQNSVALLRYRAPTSITRPTTSDTLSQLIQVGLRFNTAVRAIQDAGLCCNSFTVLGICKTPSDATGHQLRLTRLDFSLGGRIINYLRDLDHRRADDPGRQHTISLLRTQSQEIISQAVGDSYEHNINGADVFHMSSLALQFLCVGFLSYAQAHIGALQPFFLDTPLQRIVLLGTDISSNPDVYITARLVQLTCLAGMCQGPVLAFDGPTSPKGTSGEWTRRYDVRALPEDVLDTWGPGELVSWPGDIDSPLAIKVGGGYISPPSHGDGTDKYHWDRSIKMPAASSSIDMKQEILIGGLVTVNTLCGNDEGTCWKASSRRFEELGTYSSYSEPIEYQLGLQGGPDHLAITTNKVWAKRRGKTVKARNLERDDFMLVPFLDFYWGVRVSFCTGVAQRVLLRQLVADLLPAFAKSLTSKQMKAWWAELESENRILGIFHDRQQPLSDWLCSLSEDHYRFVLGLIRLVLGTLQDTGLSPEGGHFVVAWPQDGVVNRCFRMSLDEHNKWTPMLADSDDCATFAYMSNVCLEAGAIVCRGPNPTWQDRICLLETAVLCPTSAEPWTLCHEQTYFFHKLDNNLFWVKAQRDAAREALPVSLMRLISVQSLPQDIRYRLLFKEEQKRQRRLREKDLQSVPAELVLILSRKM